MIKKSTIQHLRIPFSFFLLPFFVFALSQSEKPNILYTLISFVIIHLLFYPSSNAYNSYYDKDEESIGGLENPPPVSKELYVVSVVLEVAAVLSSLIISWRFALMIVIIFLVSRAYSHPSVRLKKYPFLGLLAVSLFQGAWTYLMSFLAINELTFSELIKYEVIFPALLCTLLLLGSYPMTQVYQHGEDGRRGDLTMSRILGIRGTFLWTGIIFTFGTAGFIYYFYNYVSVTAAVLFPVFLTPTLIYFLSWFLRVLKDTKEANFKSTMRLNLLSSTCFVLYFTWVLVYKSFII